MRPTLESLVTYSTADELRRAYAPTPIEVRRLFTTTAIELETDGWLVFAILSGPVPLFDVPRWVENLVTICVPTIECYPSKSLGAWRLHSDQREWYEYSGDLVRAR